VTPEQSDKIGLIVLAIGGVVLFIGRVMSRSGRNATA
jgi:hypothetical protein